MNELGPFEQEIVNVLDEIKELFLRKNAGYNGNGNPLLNFQTGARLLYGSDGFIGCFEALKAYTAKHISNVYTHTIQAPNLEESMKDIATYMVIGTVMKRMLNAAQQEESAPKPVQESPGTEDAVREN